MRLCIEPVPHFRAQFRRKRAVGAAITIQRDEEALLALYDPDSDMTSAAVAKVFERMYAYVDKDNLAAMAKKYPKQFGRGRNE